jgi:signal transduction histidine kinase
MAPAAFILPAPQPFIRKRTGLAAPECATTSIPAGQALALAGIAHDARNLVTALRLCSDLIGEPGILAEQHAHFAGEIRSIADASDHLMRRLSALARTSTLLHNRPVNDTPIADLAGAIHDLGRLLAAVAGPLIGVEIACLPCAGSLRLSEENLTRILLNLVRNAADAMDGGGRIRITAQRGGGQSFLWMLPEAADDRCGDSGGDPGSDWWNEAADPGADPSAAIEVAGEPAARTALLTVEDDGPGIPPELTERIFEPGFSTHREARAWSEGPHRGLGLSIVRQLVEEAGGTVHAGSSPKRGARFEIELPLTNVTPPLPSELPKEISTRGE